MGEAKGFSQGGDSEKGAGGPCALGKTNPSADFEYLRFPGYAKYDTA